MKHGTTGRILSTLSLAGLLAGSTGAQVGLPARFDMGPGPQYDDWTVVTTSTLKGGNAFGWTIPPERDVLRLLMPDHVMHVFEDGEVQDDSLLQDSVIGDDDTATCPSHPADSCFEFQVEVSPGVVQCIVYLGDVGQRVEPGHDLWTTPLDQLDVYANGVLVVDDAYAATIDVKATLDDQKGGYKRVRFVVDVPPDVVGGSVGTLALEFVGPLEAPCSVQGLEIYAHQDAPIEYDRDNGLLVAHAAFPELDGFVGSMNAEDYVTAEGLLVDLDGYVPSTFKEGVGALWAHAWYLGWFKGEQEVVDRVHLDDFVGALADLNDTYPDRVSGMTLLRDALDFQRGELMVAMRGYADVPEFQEFYLGHITTNQHAGLQLLEQVDGNFYDPPVLPPAVDPAVESPFHAKARYLIARTMYGNNTKLKLTTQSGASSSVAYVDRIMDAVEELWTRVDPMSADLRFPQAIEQQIFCWRLREYYDPVLNDPPLANWTSDDPVPFGPAGSWWEDDVVPDMDLGAAPPWAQGQYVYRQLFRNVGAWWMSERKLGDELGGGTGDDVEGAAVFASPSLALLQDPYGDVVSGAIDVLDGVMFDEELVWNGYKLASQSEGIGDVEHNAEFTTNPLVIAMPLRPGAPEYYEVPMMTLSHMDKEETLLGTDPQWTVELTSPKRRHFVAWHYSSDDLGGPAPWDIPLNMKALVPAFGLIDYNGSPRAAGLLTDYANGWRKAAMYPPGNPPIAQIGEPPPKPKGLFPVAIDPATAPLPANPDEWWVNPHNGPGDFPFPFSGHKTQYSNLYAAYQRTGQTKFLKPIYFAVQWLHAVTPDPEDDPGEYPWIAAQLADDIAESAYKASRALLVEDIFDDAAELEGKLDDVIADYGPVYQQFLNEPRVQDVEKDKSGLADSFFEGAANIEQLWPFATTVVSYMDRLGIGAVNDLKAMYSTTTGDQIGAVPLPPVTWSNPDPANELHVAILVQELRPSIQGDGFMSALVWNFEDVPRSIDLHLRQDLTPGTYELEIGPDMAPQDDWIDSVTHLETVTVEHKGDPIAILDLPPGELTVINLEQQTEVPPPDPATLFDFALGPRSLAFSPTEITVKVQNLGVAPILPGAGELTLESSEHGVVAGPVPIAGISATEDSLSYLFTVEPDGTWLPDEQSFAFPTSSFPSAPIEDEVFTATITLLSGEEISDLNNAVSYTVTAEDLE